jgi:hypothetical protein
LKINERPRHLRIVFVALFERQNSGEEMISDAIISGFIPWLYHEGDM